MDSGRQHDLPLRRRDVERPQSPVCIDTMYFYKNMPCLENNVHFMLSHTRSSVAQSPTRVALKSSGGCVSSVQLVLADAVYRSQRCYQNHAHTYIRGGW